MQQFPSCLRSLSLGRFDARAEGTDLYKRRWRGDDERSDPDENGHKLGMFHRTERSGLQRVYDRNEPVNEKREINYTIIYPFAKQTRSKKNE